MRRSEGNLQGSDVAFHLQVSTEDGTEVFLLGNNPIYLLSHHAHPVRLVFKSIA